MIISIISVKKLAQGSVVLQNAQKAVDATMPDAERSGGRYSLPATLHGAALGKRRNKEQGIIEWGNNKKPLNVCALGMSVGTPAAGIRAEVIEVANFDELKKLGQINKRKDCFL